MRSDDPTWRLPASPHPTSGPFFSAKIRKEYFVLEPHPIRPIAVDRRGDEAVVVFCGVENHMVLSPNAWGDKDIGHRSWPSKPWSPMTEPGFKSLLAV
jgi:hypothetical protein